MTDEIKRAKNREYQRRYRLKAKENLSARRLDTYLSLEAKANLSLLAQRSGTTEKAVLERLIEQELKNFANDQKTYLDYLTV